MNSSLTLRGDEVASSQLAVDSQVEHSQFSHPVLHLEADAQRTDVPELERRLLPDDLALVPRLAMSGVRYGSNAGLPSS